MINLIPSKDLRDYLKEINHTFTDFEKATLIFQNHFLNKDQKHEELKKISQTTSNQELKKQIQESLQYENQFYKDFFENNEEKYIYTVQKNHEVFAYFKYCQEALDFIKSFDFNKIKGLEIRKYQKQGFISEDENRCIAAVSINLNSEIERILCDGNAKENRWFHTDCFEVHYVYIPSFFHKGDCVRNVRTNEFSILLEDDQDLLKFLDTAKKRGWKPHFVETTHKGYTLKDGYWELSFLNLSELELARIPTSSRKQRLLDRAYEAMSDYIHFKYVNHQNISEDDLEVMERNILKTTRDYFQFTLKKEDPNFQRVINAQELEDILVSLI